MNKKSTAITIVGSAGAISIALAYLGGLTFFYWPGWLCMLTVLLIDFYSTN